MLLKAKSLDSVKELIKLSAKEILEWCSINQMEANPGKFQCIIADNKGLEIPINENTVIQTESPVTLLGVLLDYKLNFNDHIALITRKATRQLNCLKRVAYALNTNIKLLLYKSFVMSNLNYCPAVWHLCGVQNTKKIEKIQFRALKFVFSDYTSSYDDLLDRAKMPSLELRRLRTIAIEVYKAYNNLSPGYISELFIRQTSGYNLRSGNAVRLRTNRTTNFGLHSFSHFGGMLWNAIPNEARRNTDLKTFKNFLYTWSGPQCQCSFCR